jgi:hypothetical protein
MRGVIGLVFWSAIGLVPLAGGLVIASRSRRRDRLIAPAPATAFIGVLAGASPVRPHLLPHRVT